MKKNVSVLSDYQAQIENRLAMALQAVSSEELTDADDGAEVGSLSSRELLQMAWDKAEEELDALQTELRLLKLRHAEQERALLSRINEKKRLQRDLLDRAPRQTAGG
jgi:hypothetical protein